MKSIHENASRRPASTDDGVDDVPPIRVVEVEVDDDYSDDEQEHARNAVFKRTSMAAAASASTNYNVQSAAARSATRRTSRCAAASFRTRSLSCISTFVMGGMVGAILVYVALIPSRQPHEMQHVVKRNGHQQQKYYYNNDDNTGFTYHEKLNPPGTCILHRSELPPQWRPPPEVSFFPQDPWTDVEQRRADYATQKGLNELIDFYDTISPQRVLNIGVDAANSLMDQCFASSNRPDFHEKACRSAARIVTMVVTPLIQRADGTSRKPECKRMKRKAGMLAYAHHLSKELPGDSNLRRIRNQLASVFKASADTCNGLDDYLAVSQKGWAADLQNSSLSRDMVKRYVHSSNSLNDLYVIPEFDPSDEMDRFTSTLWKFVANYNYTNGVDVQDGYDDGETRHVGYLVTHIAYMPTGYDRHVLLIEDAPWLYEYIRRNYWTVLQSRDVDLFAEFIDLLRQYGCTEDNDLMVRDGSRYFLHYFKSLNFTWMPDRNDPTVTDYEQIHAPWTAIAALRRRKGEPVVPGSYGYGFRKALERGVAAGGDDAANSVPVAEKKERENMRRTQR